MTPAPSPPSTFPATTWEQVLTLEEGALGDLVAWRGGLVASGCVPDAKSRCGQRIVLITKDGATWQQVAVDLPRAAGSLHVVGRRLFAIGYGYLRGIDGPCCVGGAKVWTSLDGRAWNPIRESSFVSRSIRGFVETPFGTFAIGDNAPVDSDNITGFILWPIRSNGTFDAPRAIETNGAPPLVYGAMWTGRELFGWGLRDGPMGGGPTILLVSRDGQTWTERARISAGKRTVVSDIVAVGDRLVAVGYVGRRYPLTPWAWTSDDRGQTWTPAEVPGDNAQMRDVELDGGRLVARGSEGWSETERLAAWRSNEGTAWARLPDDRDTPLVEGFRVWARATIGDRPCAVGTFDDGQPHAAAIYCRT